MKVTFPSLVAIGVCLAAVADLAAQDVGPMLAEPERPIAGEAERDIEFELFEPIETDRDSFTPATTVAGRRRTIVEAAYSFIDNRNVKETHSFPEMVLRYGIAERMELRLGWNYEVGGAPADVSASEGGDAEEEPRLETEANISYGLKFAINEQRGWLPRSAAIAQGFTPTAGLGNSSIFVGTYVFGWTLPNLWTLDAALRYSATSEAGDRFGTWAPSIVLKAPVFERCTAHVEYFSLNSDGRSTEFTKHFVSPGVHYLLTDDLEIGVRFGWGLNNEAANFFSNAGFGWRY